jgi:hypothetical protein
MLVRLDTMSEEADRMRTIARYLRMEKVGLTFGCRLYFRLVAVPVAPALVVDAPTCLSLPSVADSSPLR